MKKVFKEEVKSWSPSAKRAFLRDRNILGLVNENGNGGVCDGTTSNVIDIDDYIAEQQCKEIKR